MAKVYRGYDPRFEREVAIKVLPRDFMDDPMFRSRFEREAKTIAALEHQAIVPVYDFGEDNGQPYLVMRLMTGGSLADRLGKGPLPPSEVAAIVKRIGSALDEAHKNGIIHRDLKPGNILFDRFNDAFLADFGIVRFSEGQATLTGTQGALGTPGYMSPEQIQGEKVDSSTDIYALGVIVFEMLTGKRPYEADTPAMVMVKQLTEPTPRLHQIKPDLPADYDSLLARTMARQRTERPSTANEMAHLLASALQMTVKASEALASAAETVTRQVSEPTALPPLADPVATEVIRPKRRLPAWAWIMGGLVLIGILAVLLTSLLPAKDDNPATDNIAETEPEENEVVSAVRETATAVPPTALPSPTNKPIPTASPTAEIIAQSALTKQFNGTWQGMDDDGSLMAITLTQTGNDLSGDFADGYSDSFSDPIIKPGFAGTGTGRVSDDGQAEISFDLTRFDGSAITIDTHLEFLPEDDALLFSITAVNGEPGTGEPIIMQPPWENMADIWTDEFDGGLRPGWRWLWPDANHYNFSEQPGSLQILTQATSLYGTDLPTNLLLRPAPSGDFEIITSVSFDPGQNFQHAAILIFEDKDNFILLNRGFCDAGLCSGSGVYLDVEQDGATNNLSNTAVSATTTYLALRRQGTSFTGFYSEDGDTWLEIGRFDGRISPGAVGLMASNSNPDTAVSPIPADFHSFTINTGPSQLAGTE